MSRQRRRTPTALQSVLNSIARTAAKLCDAHDARINLLEGGHFRLAAYTGTAPLLFTNRDTHAVDRRTPQGAAVLSRRILHIRDMQRAVRDRYTVFAPIARASGMRTVLVAPLMHGRAVFGTILIRRDRVQPFTAKQIALLKTFADQAAIAIENARLSDELAARNRALSAALEQQTATSEILRVISQSPTDVHPVFDAILTSSTRLCEADYGILFLAESDGFRAVALRNLHPEFAAVVSTFRRFGPKTGMGRLARDKRSVHIPDLFDDDAYREGEPTRLATVNIGGVRTWLGVPLLKSDALIGAIVIYRKEQRAFTNAQIALVQTFADQAVIAIENVRLFRELQSKNRDLTEALEQQTATSDILQVISRSPTELQPVFEAVVARAARLCEAQDVAMLLVDGDDLRLIAGVGQLHTSLPPDFRIRVTRGSAATRAVVDRATIHVHDFAAESEDEYPIGRELARRFGHRSMLAVPLLREGLPIGVICAFRMEVRPFADQQIALLRTFADQAVIAIENVRLFKELQERNRALTEALEQQTATAEILRVISRSPTDVQPTFDAIAASARKLCDAAHGMVFRFDGSFIHLIAHDNLAPDELESVGAVFPIPPGRESVTARAILTGTIVNVLDRRDDPELDYRILSKNFPATLAVPLVRDGAVLGAITVTRAEARSFSEREIELLKTFADQAVIAIENVRLFKELQARNAELTEALDRQTATAEILRVISRSQTEIQPVFDAIVDNAIRLFRAWAVAVMRSDGQLLHLSAARGGMPGTEEYLRRQSPWPIDGALPAARCVLGRTLIHIPDAESDLSLEQEIRDLARTRGWRSVLAAPMLRDGQPIGAITVTRAEAGPFSSTEVGLLQTFADQAVIAVENARLFSELRARTDELTRSVEQLTALGEVGQAVSSTLDLETVLTTIASRAAQLTATDTCTVYEYDEAREEFHLRATHNVDDRVAELTRVRPIRKGEGATGRVAETQAPVQIEDVAHEGSYHGPLRQALLEAGVRSVLAVPLLREARLIGVFIVTRTAPGRFADEVVALLQTFATQSAIAIQNARLYRELEAKSRELEVASHHKSQFLANMSHELRTPMNAIIGYTELIADGIYGTVPEPMRDVLTRVDASGRHLLGLINDVLDLSKIEAGQLTLTLAEYSMKEVVEAVLAAAEPLAAEKRLKLVVDVAPDLPTGRGDQRRLAQVLLNLVGNAIKFTDEGHVALRIGAAAGLFAIAVSDTGPGIALADQERIFEEFQQADTSRTRPKGGTGLGLAIARRIVAMHGGRIWVESTPGAGATFRITMPVRVDAQVGGVGARR